MHIYCTTCTACRRNYCTEHIPIGQHQCADAAAAVAAGTAGGPSAAGGATRRSGGPVGSNSVLDSLRGFRRTRSREMSLGTPTMDRSLSLSSPLASPLQGMGNSGELDLAALGSPDFKRGTSDLLRRPSSFSRDPSGIGAGHAGGGASLAGYHVARGLSLFGQEMPEYLRHGSGQGGSIPMRADGPEDSAGRGVNTSPPPPPGTLGPTSHMVSIAPPKYTRSKSRELQALTGGDHQPTTTPAGMANYYQPSQSSSSSGGGVGGMASADVLLHAAASQLPSSLAMSSALAGHHTRQSAYARLGSGDSSTAGTDQDQQQGQMAMPTTTTATGVPMMQQQLQQQQHQLQLQLDSRTNKRKSVGGVHTQSAPSHHPLLSDGLDGYSDYSLKEVSPAGVTATSASSTAASSSAAKKRKSTPAHMGATSAPAASLTSTSSSPPPTGALPSHQGPSTFESEQARVDHVVQLLKSTAATSATTHSDDQTTEDLLQGWRKEQAMFAAGAHSMQPDDWHQQRLRSAVALVTLSLTANERFLIDSANGASVWTAAGGSAGGAHAMGSGGSHAGSQAGSRSHSPSAHAMRTTFLVPASSRLPTLHHPLMAPASRFLRALFDAFHMNDLEVAVLSVYLDRIEPDWMASVTDKGKDVKAVVVSQRDTRTTGAGARCASLARC